MLTHKKPYTKIINIGKVTYMWNKCIYLSMEWKIMENNNME